MRVGFVRVVWIGFGPSSGARCPGLGFRTLVPRVGTRNADDECWDSLNPALYERQRNVPIILLQR